MSAHSHFIKIAVHITAYNDAAALARVLAAIHAQSLRPETIRIVDNSPQPLALPQTEFAIHVDYLPEPTNIGTAGAINRSIAWATHDAATEYLWILDQDSEPSTDLLADLITAHQELIQKNVGPVGIIAPLTRNRDDGQPNRPLRFDRYRSRPVLYQNEPVACDFLPASGMLLYMPSLSRLKRPSDHYFLDIYDFALGLAVKKTGAGVWLIPPLELSHQVGRKMIFIKAGKAYVFSDAPASRVQLRQRNSTYLFTRTARGHYKILAAIWQLRGACLLAIRYLRFPFEQRWAKAAAGLIGFTRGLVCLSRSRRAGGTR